MYKLPVATAIIFCTHTKKREKFNEIEKTKLIQNFQLAGDKTKNFCAYDF